MLYNNVIQDKLTIIVSGTMYWHLKIIKNCVSAYVTQRWLTKPIHTAVLEHWPTHLHKLWVIFWVWLVLLLWVIPSLSDSHISCCINVTDNDALINNTVGPAFMWCVACSSLYHTRLLTQETKRTDLLQTENIFSYQNQLIVCLNI